MTPGGAAILVVAAGAGAAGGAALVRKHRVWGAIAGAVAVPGAIIAVGLYALSGLTIGPGGPGGKAP